MLFRQTAALFAFLSFFACLDMAWPSAAPEATPSGSYQSDLTFEVPPYHGLEPRVRLTYDSNAGRDIAGVGWQLTGFPEVRRVSPGKGAPRYNASDIFLLDGMELVPCTGKMKSPSCAHPASGSFVAYAFRSDTFQRVAFKSDRTGGRWYVWDKNGTQSIYATIGKVRPTRALRWHLTTVQDTLGNTVRYTYAGLGGGGGFTAEQYPRYIDYNGARITCYYEDRPDPATYAGGDGPLVLKKKRLKSVTITVSNAIARAYSLEYDPDTSVRTHSRLVAVKQYGSDAMVDNAGTLSGSSLPLIRMLYTPVPQTPWSTSTTSVGSQPSPGSQPASLYPDVTVNNVRVGAGAQRPMPGPIVTGDFNGDGRTDWLALGFTGATAQKDITINAVLTAATTPLVVRTSQSFTPDSAWVAWDRLAIYAWALDLNGDGRTDLLIGVGYEPASLPIDEQIALMPALSRGDGTFAIGAALHTDIIHLNVDPEPPACRAGDFDGNGLMDLACHYEPRVNQQLGATESFLTVILAQRDGTLALSNAKLPFHDNGGIRSFAVGDANRDGRSDLFFVDIRGADLDARANGNPTADLHYDFVTALSQGGDASTYTYSRTETPWFYISNPIGHPDLSAADIDGDGRPDFVVLPHSAQKGGFPLSILTGLQRPDSTLVLAEQQIPVALSSGQHIVTIGDANGDGLEDLLVASKRDQGTGTGCRTTSATADIVLNRVPSKGDGTFALPVAWDDCSVARQIDLEWDSDLRALELRAVDTNGDGLADYLLAANSPVDPAAAILHDDVSSSTGLDAFRWIPADISGDGRRGFVYVQPLGNQTIVHTLLAQPGGGFARRSQHLAPDLFGLGRQIVRGWKIMDVDGDGRTDLVYVHSAGTGTTRTGLVEVEVIFADGYGGWSQAFGQRFTWPGALADAALLMPADVDGDGKVDLVSLMNSVGTGSTGSGVSVQTLMATGNRIAPFQLGTNQPALNGTGDDSGTWRGLDVDGDGKTDLLHIASTPNALILTTLLARENGTWQMTKASIPQTAAEGWNGISATDSLLWRDVDLNGDGKMDLVHLVLTATSLRIHTLMSGGDGAHWMQHSQDIPLSSADLLQLNDRTAWVAVDLDRDGRTDIVHVNRNASDLGLYTLTSSGDGLFTVASATAPDPGSGGNRASPTWLATDIDGDGQGDLTRVDLASAGTGVPAQLEVSTVRSIRSNELLTVMTNPFGGITEIHYQPASDYIVSQPALGCSLPVGATLQVVAWLTLSDGRGTSETRHLGYGCPKWSRYHRAFLGWTDVSTQTDAAPNHPALWQTDRYQQTDQCFTQLQDTAFRDAYGNYIASREIRAYSSPGRTAPYRCLILYRQGIDYGTSILGLNTLAYFDFDDFGNLTGIRDLGSMDVTGDEVTTTISHRYAYQPWLVGLPWQRTTVDPAQPNVLLRSTFFCYDGNNGSAGVNCPGTPTQGLLTGVQRVDDLGLYVTHTYQYDRFGNLAAKQNPLHFGTATFFDNTYHVFPTGIVNALSHSSTLEWDTTLSRLKKVTDPNNAIAETQYDVFGRPRLTTLPSGATLHREYLDWGDPNHQRIHEYADDGSTDGLWTDTYLDGFGRVYQIIRKGDAPNVSFIQQYGYSDASDRVHTTTHWYRSGTTAVPTESFEYDDAGRLKKQTHPDLTTRTISYDADTTGTTRRIRNERGIDKTIAFDAYGRLARVTQLERATAQTATVRYAYNPVDEPVSVTDANGNITKNTWDVLGRLRKVESPDFGTRTRTYYLTGTLKTHTDARNHTTTYTYDGLDRLRTKTYASGQAITWNYDEPGHGASKGRLTSTTDLVAQGCAQGHSDEYSYDALGKVTTQLKCIDGRSYTTGFGYDPLARLEHITYPDNETVTYGFDSAGRTTSASGYVNSIEYDASGAPTHIEYANTTAATFTFDPKRAWQDTASIVDAASSVLYDATYVHEPNGLVKSTSSGTNVMNVAYTYDDFDRLRDATGDVTQNFMYDANGNTTYSSTALNYGYPVRGTTGCTSGARAQPCNAPTTIGLSTVLYDANGNLSMTTLGNQMWSIDWNDDQQPMVYGDVNGVVTTYGYGAAGERVSQQNTNSYLRYFNSFVEHSSTAGLIKNYYVGDLLIARNSGGTKAWFHSDALGSTRLVTDSTGAILGRFDYAPFGAQVGTTGTTFTTPMRFTGQPTDDSGLVYMRDRYYDPTSGRFTSPDTLIADASNTQAVNPYSYAYNNPLSYIDPTGHQPEGISQTWTPDGGAFSVSISVVDVPTPLLPAGTGLGCANCRGGNNLYADAGTPPTTAGVQPTASSTEPDPRQNYKDVQEGIDDSGRVISYWQRFLDGKITWEDATSHMVAIGNGGVGITEAGRTHPRIVQDAIEEGESLHFDDLWQMAKTAYSLFAGQDTFRRMHAEIEIDRQTRLNNILRRLAIERGPGGEASQTIGRNPMPLLDIRLYRGF